MRRTIYFVLPAAMLGFAVPAQASWLSKITGVHINPSKGEFRIEKPDIGAIPEMLQNLPKDVAQFVLNPAGAALAEAIRISRNTHIGSAQPVPADIRAQLAPYFPANILNQARYRVKSGAISLPSIINTINRGNAVTLDDLIVFDNATQAQNLELWAHELTHVMQYKNMGVESFANVYSATGGQGLEGQARDNANTIIKAINNSLPAGVTPSYQYASTAFTAPTPHAAYIQEAQKIVPPQICMNFAPHPAGVMVNNGCVVPVTVTAWTYAGPMGPYTMPCPYNCVVPPMTSKPFGPVAGPVMGFYYAW